MQKNHYVGLSDAEVLESRLKNGANVLTPPEKEPLWMKFLEKFSDPLIVILLVAGALSIGISCYEYFGLQEGLGVFFEPIGIFVAILLATGLAFIFELKADREFAILNQVNDDEFVKVIRNGNMSQVSKKDIVVGDIVIIETGDDIPADGELLESVTLHVDESTLTGEPICSKTTNPEEFDKEATFASNHVMRGTKVMEGHGVMRVFAVGDNTENGKVFEAAQIDNSTKTPLNEQLDGLGTMITNMSYTFAALIIVGKLLVYFNWDPLAFTLILPIAIFFYLLIKKFDTYKGTVCIAIVAIFFATFIATIIGINMHIGKEISELLAYTLETLMIAVTLIVVAVPEGLPMAVTLSLAYSMRKMLQTQNLVRKMHACETMGATTVICTDKTGTLTQNQMRVHETNFFSLADQKLTDDELSSLITEGISVNSTASLDLSSADKPSVLGNPTEGALLLWLRSNNINYLTLKEDAPRLEELPFSTERKYMATVVKSSLLDGKTILYVKGAPEIVHSLCKNTCANKTKEEIDSLLLGYQNQAMRTLGFAYQILNEGDKTIVENKVVADNLTFLGVCAIADPVRSDVPEAVGECLTAGINIKIVTGDTPGTAREIGRQIGLWKEDDTMEKNLITGPEFAALTDQEVMDRVLDLKIIARARPMDKKRLVESLQKKNQVVAVTGDGTNDAPALKAAHVGLSMGDGTSVAKEASDITIIDNSFSSIGRAVMWGRSLYQNIQRFILFQMTVNVVACFIVLVGAFMGTESPLTVTQMLWVNLIMDTFAAMALASLPPTKKVMYDKPRDREAFIISKAMATSILSVGLLFFLGLFGLLYILQHYEVSGIADLANFFNLQETTEKAIQLSAQGMPMEQISFNLDKPIDVIERMINPKLTDYELSMFFTVFVMLQFWNMFNARAFMTGRSAFHFKDCGGFLFIAFAIIIGQILIVTIGGEMFNVVPLKIEDWLYIIGGTSVVLWIGEIVRLFTRK
ncbi:MAG: cation-translocating P-type ATPase [Paludibacteraceae bacterium]|nr:cation-translocating P-type ATPase [Paludibacteraceae bacterium]